MLAVETGKPAGGKLLMRKCRGATVASGQPFVDTSQLRDFGSEDAWALFEILPFWSKWKKEHAVWQDIQIDCMWAAGEDAVAELLFPNVL